MFIKEKWVRLQFLIFPISLNLSGPPAFGFNMVIDNNYRPRYSLGLPFVGGPVLYNIRFLCLVFLGSHEKRKIYLIKEIEIKKNNINIFSGESWNLKIKYMEISSLGFFCLK